MGVRKNAKFLTPAERESFVRALVGMKADIVNPAAPAADQYSRWDEYVAVHRLIQSVNTPSAVSVNFGHGGLGAYGFLAWHRYFLFLLEQRLQSYVPGVMLPYWDWTAPIGTILVNDFLGPNGNPAFGNEVRQGYFAREAPGTGINATPAPAWWPAGLTGWNLHAAFGAFWVGALRRSVGAAGALPSAATVRSAMAKTSYSDFQNALESGTGTSPFHSLHNGLHGWFGGGAHMSSVVVSPFDPIFYLHHCNVDRLWAMWQLEDGNATLYPTSGGAAEHHRDDPMYPWVGATAGYSSNYSFPPITMPDFSALGIVTAADVLDHRALGYSYDTQVVLGVALDRTGSMLGMTPDPMTTLAPDVTKWEAAKRGVSAFLQDCEAAYQDAQAYVVGGVKTFRRLGANEFVSVFPGTPYGLVKPGGTHNQATFDASVAAMTPGGSTPLVDALADTHATLVAAPFGGLPADERRYLALLTDGMRTSGSPMSAIPNGSLTNTAVFAMGFGTGADVDYATLAALVAKGETLGTTQVFHGENAGVIDKFYSQALAAALGFSPVIDPVVELFEGEHTHIDFSATSAEDAFFITAQGMDFDDEAWSYQLIGPDGSVVYADGATPGHGHGSGHAERRPDATARRGRGRLSLFVRRDNADAAAWVGGWQLMVAWRARLLDAMVMLDPGELIVPVAAGPIRGRRYSRLLIPPQRRVATRNVKDRPRHRLDVRPTSTNRSERAACTAVVNIYAQTRLRIDLRHSGRRPILGRPMSVEVHTEVLQGAAQPLNAFSRLLAPAADVRPLLAQKSVPAELKKAARLPGGDRLTVDSALVLAGLERRQARLARPRDLELAVVTHHGGEPHVQIDATDVPGAYHLGVWVEGTYDPGCQDVHAGAGHHLAGGAHAGSAGERFTRLLSLSVGLGGRRR